jgi:hypothetical protein
MDESRNGSAIADIAQNHSGNLSMERVDMIQIRNLTRYFYCPIRPIRRLMDRRQR